MGRVEVVLLEEGRMRGAQQSLAQYARRRYALAGAGLLSGFNPYFLAADELRRHAESRGLSYVSFAQYDYLGIGEDERFRDAAAAAVHLHGVGAGASRLVGGERTVHRQLEQDLASFVGTEDALAMVSGYGANVSLIGHLLTSGDAILVDEYAHNSIFVGTSISRAEKRTFAHNDLDDLNAQLKAERGRFKRALVVVEGLFSMDGDVPDLPRLLDICERHGAWLMIDEAHSIGVLGANGRGVCEHFGVDPARVDLIVGTFSKALATCGGFVCAKQPVVEWLRYTLPGFVYSVGMPPHIAAALRTALATIIAEPERLGQLKDISQYFVHAAQRDGFDVGDAIGAGVVPIMLEDPAATMMASKALMDEGIYVPPVVQIGIPKDRPRLRFFLSTRHTMADIDRVFDVLGRWRRCWSDQALAEVAASGTRGRAAPSAPFDIVAELGTVPIR